MTEVRPDPDVEEGVELPDEPMRTDDALLDEPDEDVTDDADPAEDIPEEAP